LQSSENIQPILVNIFCGVKEGLKMLFSLLCLGLEIINMFLEIDKEGMIAKGF